MHALEQLFPGIAAYPDIHPMLVHFPVALLPTALLLATLSLGPSPRAHATARLLLVLGTLGMLAAAATGLHAQGILPHGRGSLVFIHRTLMLITAGLAVILSVLAFRFRDRDSRGARVFLAAGLLVVNTALAVGADRGALVSLRILSQAVPLPSPGTQEVASARSDAGSEGDPARGRDLYQRLGCAGCHGPDRKSEGPGIPPTLEYAGSKLRSGWMRDYLLSPHRIRWIDEGKRPVLRMPDYELLPAEAADLAAFLASKTDSTRFPELPVRDLSSTSEAAANGRALVAQYACRGCHSIGGVGSSLGPALDGVGSRLRPAYVYAFLKGPKRVIPGTPMTDFHLWDDEAKEITAYLWNLRESARHEDGNGDRK